MEFAWVWLGQFRVSILKKWVDFVIFMDFFFGFFNLF
jgi:hypothetical protein